jgi:hypothetical protein
VKFAYTKKEYKENADTFTMIFALNRKIALLAWNVKTSQKINAGSA